MSEPDLLENWLEIKLANEGKSPKTIDKYRNYLLRLLDWLPESNYLDATPGQLQEFTGIHLHRQNIAPRSRRVVVAAVRGFYTWLAKTSVIQSNPAAELVYPKEPDTLPIAMGLKDTEKLLMAPDISTFAGIRDAAIIALFAGCGFRVKGLEQMNQGDLFYFEYKGQSRMAVQTTEKGGKERNVPVPYEAMMLLQLYLKRPELNEIDRLLPDGDQVLFVSLNNKKCLPDEYRGENRRFAVRSIQQMFKNHGRAAGIPEEFLHTKALRHQVGRELTEGDVPLLVIQEVLGHKDPKTTRIYTRLAMGKMSDSMDRANPLSKINTPVSELVQEMRDAGHLA